jgi:hypothetical protein
LRCALTSQDELSGVETTFVSLNDEPYKPYAKELILEREVAVTLRYYAVDRVGNREAEQNVPFYLDRLPPTTDAQVEGDLFVAPNGTRYVSTRSRIKLSAEDNKSGVDKITYAVDEGAFLPYAEPFALPARAGSGKVSYRASDKLGNTSAVAALPYTLDLTPPQSTYKIAGPYYQVRSDIYITSATRIELSSTDDASGVARTQFQEEGEPQPHDYTAPLTYPDEGRRLVRYWSTDRVNNREQIRALVLITDNTPPQIFANFSLSKNASTDADGLPVYRRQTSLFLGATDNASGVHKIYYSFDGGKEMEYSTPLVLDREGAFDLEIRVDDNLGNQASKHLRFAIKG